MANATKPGELTQRAVLRGIRRANEMPSHGIDAHHSGFPELNAELPGHGWPAGMLTELIAREAGIGELRLLIPLLRRLTAQRQVVILLAPPMVPYAPALAGFGVDLDYLIVIQAQNAADRLWAVEQTLRSDSFGTLLAWLPQKRTRPEHLRRLQLAAQTATGPVFLFRQLDAQFDTSPAPLRLLLLPRPNEQLSVQVLKRRGPVMAMPIMLTLPRPDASIQLRPTEKQPDRHTPMHTVHATSGVAPDVESTPDASDKTRHNAPLPVPTDSLEQSAQQHPAGRQLPLLN